MKDKPQETDFYKTFYEELKSLSNEQIQNWLIYSRHHCQMYGDISDDDYIIICICEDILKERELKHRINKGRKIL